jgi:hypothetical protein
MTSGVSVSHNTESPALPVDADMHGHGHGQQKLVTLALGAVGVVFGDIGTSPLYAFRETFAGHHTLEPNDANVLGVLSLIFWSMMLVVTVKYVMIIMRADNKGEGGSLALLALISRSSNTKARRWTRGLVLLGVFATALFYGDSMITPAISVLTAVEGLGRQPGFAPFVLPIAIGILIGLFAIQQRGVGKVGLMFGPVMVVYFLVLAVLGIVNILATPSVFIALNPWYAVQFFVDDGVRAFLAMGSVVLAVTGAEALYADMGHFGRNPIRVSWLFFVLPALMLNYLGQGAMILAATPADALRIIHNPFFLLAPDSLRLPLVILATMATVIASQAVISGAFSVTQQAIQLGFMPSPAHRTYQRQLGRADLHPGDQLGADGDGLPAGPVLPLLVQSGGRLWYRGDRRDADRHVPDRSCCSNCGSGTSLRPASCWRRSASSISLISRQPHQGARRRLVPAADGLHHLHDADDLGARARADDRAHARGGDAGPGVRPLGRQFGHARARHRGVHDLDAGWRAARAAAQS